MPTFIHTMPLSPNWRGRPDPFGGVAEGIMVETSHVTIQGIKMLGMPMVEHPKPGQIFRVYPIARYDTALDDLVITQCMFAGDEVTNPNHLAILVNGSRLVVDHCLFYGVKQTVVFWTPGAEPRDAQLPRPQFVCDRCLDLWRRQRLRLPEQRCERQHV